MLRCAVVGASGYSGAELVSLLALHPETELVSLCADSSAGSAWGDVHPRLAAHFDGQLQTFDASRLAGLDVVFLALPASPSAAAAAALQGKVSLIIDLSGGLRLPDGESYERWYGEEHPAPELLGKAVYGLPELFGCAFPGARLVACAGCYATAAQLAAGPALAGLPVEGKVTINGMSGTSGAGRKASLPLLHAEVHGDVRAYRVGQHQHVPEMTAGLTRHAGRSVQLTFVPHIVPMERGLLTTAVMGTAEPLSHDVVLQTYRDAYESAPLVRVLDTRQRQARVRDVAGTSYCDVAPTVDQATGDVVVTAVIDNLLKGAAGQAVQVMNLIQGFPETLGLVPGTGR